MKQGKHVVFYREEPGGIPDFPYPASEHAAKSKLSTKKKTRQICSN